MTYLFRLVLLCIPLFGAVAATAEVQRIDRAHLAQDVQPVVETEAQAEMVLALNTLSPVVMAAQADPALSTDEQSVTNQVMVGASAGLPFCLALVLLVALVRQRA